MGSPGAGREGREDYRNVERVESFQQILEEGMAMTATMRRGICVLAGAMLPLTACAGSGPTMISRDR
jgi:hypothetical protein